MSRKDVALPGSAALNNVCNFSDVLGAVASNIKFIEQVEKKLNAAQRLRSPKMLKPEDERKLLSIELHKNKDGDGIVKRAKDYSEIFSKIAEINNVKIIREVGRDGLPAYLIHANSGAIAKQGSGVADAIINVCQIHDQLLGIVSDIGDIKGRSQYYADKFIDKSREASSAKVMSKEELADMGILAEKILQPIKAVEFVSLPEESPKSVASSAVSRSAVSTAVAISPSSSARSSSPVSPVAINSAADTILQQLSGGKSITDCLDVVRANREAIQQINIKQFDKILKDYFTSEDGKPAILRKNAIQYYIDNNDSCKDYREIPIADPKGNEDFTASSVIAKINDQAKSLKPSSDPSKGAVSGISGNQKGGRNS